MAREAQTGSHRNPGETEPTSAGGAPLELLDERAIIESPAMFASAARHSDRIVLVWSTTPDGWPGGELAGSWSDDGGRTWAEKITVATPAEDEDSVVNALSLSVTPDARYRFVYNGIRWPDDGSSAGREATVSIVHSEDGTSWSAPSAVETGFAFAAVYGEIVATSDGLVMPIWGRREPHEHWRSALLHSADDGKTWDVRSTIAFAPVSDLPSDYVDAGATGLESNVEAQITDPAFRPHDSTGGFNETSVVSDGALGLVAAVRQQGVRGASHPLALFTTSSNDGGRTWDAPAECGVNGMSPCLRRLDDGRLLLAYRRAVGPGAADSAAVEVRVGSASGREWSDPLVLPTGASQPLPFEYQVGYPAIVAGDAADEFLVFSYSYAEPGGRHLRMARICVTA